jgi:hypothetical protein
MSDLVPQDDSAYSFGRWWGVRICFCLIQFIVTQNKKHIWVTFKIGLNGLDPDLDPNKHRINLE